MAFRFVEWYLLLEVCGDAKSISNIAKSIGRNRGNELAEGVVSQGRSLRTTSNARASDHKDQGM